MARLTRWMYAPRPRALTLIACLALAVAVAAVPLAPRVFGARTPAASGGTRPVSLATWKSDGAWFQRLIYLYASGNAPIQRQALVAGQEAGLASGQVSQVSAAVRATWLRLMRDDPATLGRPSARPNLHGQQADIAALRGSLRHITGSHYTAFLASTEHVYKLASSSTWLQHAGLLIGIGPQPPRPTKLFVTVWATSFSIQGQPASSQYVALPDAYLKYATLGLNDQIPAIYQPYYLHSPSNHLPIPYTVDIAQIPSNGGATVATQVPTLDVGPWNEDDNWWDPYLPTTQMSPNCPVSSSLVSTHSLDNPAVDGICPGGSNWRRVAYYLLYQHFALPFFQPGGYAPSGTFADATSWPTVLPRYCPEAAAASAVDQNVPCATAFANYNGNNGAWLRDGSYQSSINNQSAIDLSPAVGDALGWTWPASGFIQVNVARLP
jgi:hypothetical protein